MLDVFGKRTKALMDKEEDILGPARSLDDNADEAEDKVQDKK